MTKALATVEKQDQNTAIFKVVTSGDTSKLTDAQKMQYYLARCEESGLDPATTPFQFIRLSGREILYALKAATDQLSRNHKLKMTIASQETVEGVRVVTVRAEAPDGRVQEEIGSVPISGLKGENLSNALMKCVTKAKRRAVLSITGLGMLDETEVASITGPDAGAKPFGGTDVDQEFPEPKATGLEDAPDPETLEPPVTDAEIVEETQGRVIEVKEVEKPKRKSKDSSAFKDDTTSDASDWMMVGKAVRVHALDKKKVKEGYIEHFGIESMKELNRGQIRELIYLMGGSKKKAWAK